MAFATSRVNKPERADRPIRPRPAAAAHILSRPPSEFPSPFVLPSPRPPPPKNRGLASGRPRSPSARGDEYDGPSAEADLPPLRLPTGGISRDLLGEPLRALTDV